MVTTAMLVPYLCRFYARHRLKPGPGDCCDAGPAVKRDRPACAANSEWDGRRGADARSQSVGTGCGKQFTRSQQVLCPQCWLAPLAVPRWTGDMRWVAVILAAALLWASPARGDSTPLGWPAAPGPPAGRT